MKNITNEQISVPGYSKSPDELKLYNHLSLYHRGRIWELRCSIKTGKADSLPLGNEDRLNEQFSLALFLVWRSIVAMTQLATTRFYRKLCLSNRDGLRRDR